MPMAAADGAAALAGAVAAPSRVGGAASAAPLTAGAAAMAAAAADLPTLRHRYTITNSVVVAGGSRQ